MVKHIVMFRLDAEPAGREEVEHLACVAIIKPVLAGRTCVDYTVE